MQEREQEERAQAHIERSYFDVPCISLGYRLMLDAAERRLRGVNMDPLLKGEFQLLMYLGTHCMKWHSSYSLCSHVYGRDDPGARQLVWKYASTLRKKLAKELPTLIELCRRRGYRCRHPVSVVEI